jgi:hypothetical protein
LFLLAGVIFSAPASADVAVETPGMRDEGSPWIASPEMIDSAVEKLLVQINGSGSRVMCAGLKLKQNHLTTAAYREVLVKAAWWSEETVRFLAQARDAVSKNGWESAIAMNNLETLERKVKALRGSAHAGLGGVLYDPQNPNNLQDIVDRSVASSKLSVFDGEPVAGAVSDVCRGIASE